MSSNQASYLEPVPSTAARILIADDDKLVSAPLRRILVADGYSVECVETGWSAAKLLAGGSFDLLITDICMPGNMALDLLRAPEVQAQHLPVILITGYPSLDTAVEAVRLSVVEYIIKPVLPEPFLAAVRRALSRKTSGTTMHDVELQLVGVTHALESVQKSLASVRSGARNGAPEQPTEPALQSRLTTEEFAALSPREREILALIARGRSTNEIAGPLGISISTVRNHLKAIYRKMGVTSQVSLVRKLMS